MASREWVIRWKYEVAAKPSSPGIWRLRSGGYLVRARVTNPRTGKRRDQMRVLPEAKLPEAQAARAELLRDERHRVRGTKASKQLFATYAVSLLARKIKAGELGPSTQSRWNDTLTLYLVPAFGALYVDEIGLPALTAWRNEIAEWITSGRTLERKREGGSVETYVRKYSPRSANGWISILRVIMGRAATELELPKNAAESVDYFDNRLRRTYTREKPNSLTGEWARKFTAKMAELYPQHHAMTLLGFITGLRPSTLRPLRRSGDTPDVLWDTSRLLVRRSNPLGQEVADHTKTGLDQDIYLPPEVMAVLRAHVDGLKTEAQQASELLFPATHGGFMSRSALDKPFKRVAAAIGLPFPLTPRGMRRTFKDLCRLAGVSEMASKAVSGHQTEQMHEHYQTVQGDEMRAELAKVAALLQSNAV